MKSFILVLAGLLQLASANFPVSYKQCPQACADLKKSLGSNSVSSTPVTGAYWATQIQAIQAACYVYPSTPKEVSTVIQTTSKYKCPFAVAGGAHSDVAGASNIANGLVLSLSKFTQVQLSQDKTSAAVGGGSIWGDVYDALDPLNYTVIGGRETTVGVGGLTLGGGISYFSGTYGFACDNVLSYDVVLGDGTITNVSPSNKPDLYRALRGGGNNFAVVTTFHLAAFKYTALQGGLEIYSDSSSTQSGFLKAFDYFANNAPESPDAAMYMSFSFSKGTPLWISGLSYSVPTPSIPSVPAYKLFYTQALNASKIASTQRTASHSNFATELGATQPGGFREQFHTGTYKVNYDFLNDVYNQYRTIVARVQKQLAGTTDGTNFSPALAFQAITKNELQAQYQRGGNVLGLSDTEAPLMIASMAWSWSDPKHDDIFNCGMQDVVDYMNQQAQKRGLSNPFIYMNYAQTGLPVVAGYGDANVKFMKQVSAKYDPQGVFQYLAIGGFKLP